MPSGEHKYISDDAAKELVGDRFGLWTVVNFVGRRTWNVETARKRTVRKSKNYKNTVLIYECLCDCGTKRMIQKSNLTGGKTTSCRSCSSKRRQEKRCSVPD